MDRKRIEDWIFILLLACALYALSNMPMPKRDAYQVGTLTKGNPDNTYLDSYDIYCCGD